MGREKAQAIIYRLTRYSDESAIGEAFTLERGIVKLFVQKAFTKKGGVLCFVPGELDYNKKETSDLHKLYSFRPEPEKLSFLDCHDILLRLHLVFEILKNLYGIEEPDERLWKILNRFTDENYRKITAYAVCHLMYNAGIVPELRKCSVCGGEFDEGIISDNSPVCSDCVNLSEPEPVNAPAAAVFFLRNHENSEFIRKLSINRENEIKILKFLVEYIEKSTETKLKSAGVLFNII